MSGAVLALLVCGFVLAAPLAALLIRLGHRAGALDSAGSPGHSKTLRGVPNIGGVAIMAGFCLPLLVGLAALSWACDAVVQVVPQIGDHLARLQATLPTAWAVLVALLLVHGLGLLDDRRAIGALPKAAIQLAIALVLAAAFDVRALTLLDAWPGGWMASVVISALWMVLVCNAVNYLDNMDGLAGGVSAIAALLLMAATIANHQWFVSAECAVLAGAIGGFLLFNFPWRGSGRGARIFMGDGGSLLIGMALGILTIRITYADPADPAYSLGGQWYGALAPLLVLAVPLFDLVTVSLMRIREGKSPFVGDQRHISHRLVGLGLTPRGAVLALCALGAITGVGGILLGSLAPWQAGLVAVQGVAALSVVWLIERALREP